ncbi:MAG: cupin-like domain-containing protein [Alteromonadaceae bacterium]|nr:cupin-like domain-containing protein [Alteromonadaceae bacterium]
MLIEERTSFDEAEFKKNFLNKKTVVYRNQIESWPAVKKWTPAYFSRTCPDVPIVAKTFEDSEVIVRHMTMKGYVDLIDAFQAEHGEASEKIGPYCHDVPIFTLAKQLENDIGKLPLEILPDWYAKNWSRYVQFFMSPKGSVTPLHFDTLLTNNIFFQIKGKKRFTIISNKDGKYCNRRNWRWFNVDPENSDFHQYPEYKKADVDTVQVNAGDMIYMPPGELHHVRSLDDCISFNIDFHTISSAVKSFNSIVKGMPKINIYYNYLSLKALLNIGKGEKIFERYRGYLNYVS